MPTVPNRYDQYLKDNPNVADEIQAAGQGLAEREAQGPSFDVPPAEGYQATIPSPATSFPSQRARNKYDRFIEKNPGVIDEIGAGIFKRNLAANTLQALKANPDLAAKANRLAEIMNLPQDVVEREYGAAELQQRQNDYEQALRASPEMAKFWQDPYNAKVTSDDAGVLEKLNYVGRSFKAAGPITAGGLTGLAAFGFDAIERNVQQLAAGSRDLFGEDSALGKLFGSYDPDNPNARLAQRYAAYSEEWMRLGSEMQGEMPAGSGTITAGLASGAVSTAQMVPLYIASVLTRNPSYALGGAGLIAGSQTITGAPEDMPAWKKALWGVSDAGIEIATEMLPFGKLLKDLKAGAPFLNVLANQVAREVPSELVAETLQSFNEWSLNNQERPFTDYLESLPETLAQTVVATFFQTGVLTGASHTVNKALMRVDENLRKAEAAEANWERLTVMIEEVGGSNTIKRDPQTIRNYVDQVTINSEAPQIFLEGEVLLQSGLTDQLVAAIPSLAEQVDIARETGGDVSINTSDFVTQAALNPDLQPLIELVKTDPDGMSRAEATALRESGLEAEVAAEVERAVVEAEQVDPIAESRDKVTGIVRDQLDALGRNTTQANESYAALVGQRYAAVAEQLGMTPEEVYYRYPLLVVAEDITGLAPGALAQEERAPVATLAGQELGEDLQADNVTERAYSWFQNNLQGTTVEREGVGPVRFSGKGWRKLKRGLPTDLDKARLIPAIPEIIRNGEYTGRFPIDKPRKDDIVAFHHFQGPVKLGDKIVQAGVSVAEDAFGNLFYNLNRDPQALLEKRKAALLPGLEAQGARPTESSDFTQEKARGAEPSEGGPKDAYEQSLAPNAGGINLTVDTFEQAARGSFSPENLTIALGKNADLSTFLHETGHFFLEMQIDLANRMTAEARDTALTQEKQQLIADTNVLLGWFGLQDLQTWNALPFEEKRSYHEQFARGFETYLFEGVSPSIEMQGVFQRFRNWLVAVYRDLRNLGVELNDEVRGVMDRMLASGEQIRLAQEARRMEPMFTTAEQAGMTPEEFAAYQEVNRDATNDAIEEQQTRSLRDMRWLHKAYSREIARLQKEAAALRREVQMEAVTEVMSQPVYQAWSFLTRRIEPEDRIPPSREKASETVDQNRDSMFTAIAKLGGVDRTQAQEQWGIDDAIDPPVFGKPVLRVQGGLSIEAMAEALGEYGYLTRDAGGKVELSDFEQAVHDELIGSPRFSTAYDYHNSEPHRAGDQVVNPSALLAGRFDLPSLREMGYSATEISLLEARRMTAAEGLHPDIVADVMRPLTGYDSGDAMVRAILTAEAPSKAIEAVTDARMIERYGDMATPEAIERSADKAIHNEARARMVATEAKALDKALGRRSLTNAAAKMFAQTVTSRSKIRNLKPTRFAQAAAKLARQAAEASRKGDIATAAVAKRNETMQHYAAREAYRVEDEIDRNLRYLRKFDREITTLDVEYKEQIDTLLERFDLRRGQTLTRIDRLTSLNEWIAAQEDEGIEPDIPDYLRAEAVREHYKNLTVEQFRGLVDTVRQIEHLGRLKHRLLTNAENRRLAEVVDGIKASMAAATEGKPVIDNEVRNEFKSRLKAWQKGFAASHRTVYSLVREMDGYKDGGAFWEAFVRPMNDAGNREATMRAEAAQRLYEISKPLLEGSGLVTGKIGGEGQYFASVGRSLNRGERLAIALNWGNEGNRQRLLDGRGWTVEQLAPVLRSLTPTEWQYVQNVWDFFESYRPQIAEKERRVNGTEPEWIEPAPFTVTTEAGETVQVRGGYYPIKYDPDQSAYAKRDEEAQQAREMLRAAYTSATTRRTFTKTRAKEVRDRPIALSLDPMYTAANEVIHDLTWHEWLIDANKLMRALDPTIRQRFGAQKAQALRAAIKDIAHGDAATYSNQFEKALVHLRNGSTVTGLGWNLRVALLQPLGLSNSIVYTGAPWIARGLTEFYGTPSQMAAKVAEVQQKSEFMRNRSRTLNREVNDVANQLVRGQTEARRKFDASVFWLIAKTQAMVDYPTWLGAYQKAAADPANVNADGTLNEARLVALADQAVIAAQSSGMTKDLSQIQRGGPLMKLFTNFYSFFATTLNLAVESSGRTNYRNPTEVMRLAQDYLLLLVVPAIGSLLINAMLRGVGDDDDELIKHLVDEQLSMLLALSPLTRELGPAVQMATGSGFGMGYSGPAGLRFFNEVTKLGHQVNQGEIDMTLFKAANNTLGILFHYPAGQINRTVEGTMALLEGETENPMAVFGGKPRQ